MANQIERPDLAPDDIHPLVAYRRQHRMTQKALGSHLDVARETVARWETGRPIDDKLLPRVAERTGIPRATLRPDLAKLLEEVSTEERSQ